MKIKKLVILDKNEFNQKQKEELKKVANQIIIFDDLPINDNDAIKRIKDADAIIVCWYSINKYILDFCPNIKYLGIVATGYDWCDVESAIQKGIIVTNIPFYATNTVSNYVFKQLKNININKKTLGVIGLGNIGTNIAKLGKYKNMNVISWNRTEKKSNSKAVKFEELFECSDIITLHLKLNSETEKIIKKKQLDLIKKNSIIVNTVSSKLFENLDYLIKTVKSKNIKLILDFDEENKLSELSKTNKNIIYTPHIAWKSKKSIFVLHQVAIENIKSYINNGFKNQIK